MLEPAKRMSPLVGSYTPVIRLKNVVFPAPFGPITLHDLALVDVEVEVVDDGQAAERHRHATQLEQLLGHGARRSPRAFRR